MSDLRTMTEGELRAELMGHITQPVMRWDWIHHRQKDIYFRDVVLHKDGTVEAQSGDMALLLHALIDMFRREKYRQTVMHRESEALRISRIGIAAKQKKREEKLNQVVAQFRERGKPFEPSDTCLLCNLHMKEEVLVFRGFGNTCWNRFLGALTEEEANLLIDHATPKPEPEPDIEYPIPVTRWDCGMKHSHKDEAQARACIKKAADKEQRRVELLARHRAQQTNTEGQNND